MSTALKEKTAGGTTTEIFNPRKYSRLVAW